MRYGALLLLAASVACNAAGAPRDSKDLELSIPPDVESATRPHAPQLPVLAEALSLSRTVSIRHKMNFDSVQAIAEHEVNQWLSNGLLSSTAIGSDKGSPNEGVSAQTSVCGLVPLLVESSARSRSQQWGAIPGATHVQFGFSLNQESATKSRVTSFSTSAANICAPKPATTFEFKTVRQQQYRVNVNGFRSDKISTIAQFATCHAHDVTRPASEIDKSFRGQYLPVSCTDKDQKGQHRSSEYAFLLASGIYIQISEKMKYQTNAVEYGEISYK